MTEDIVILKTRKDFYEKGIALHRHASTVYILSKTPGLIIPSERSDNPDYFDVIDRRLNDTNVYNVCYLFDRTNTLNVILDELSQLDDPDEQEQLTRQIRQNLETYRRRKNLALYFGNTEPLTGMVLSDDYGLLISLRRGVFRHLSRGIFITSRTNQGKTIFNLFKSYFDYYLSKSHQLVTREDVEHFFEELSRLDQRGGA